MHNKIRNVNQKEMLLVHCTQANKSGAAKYVSELFLAVRKLFPDALLVCPQDFEHKESHPASSLIFFEPLQGVGRIKKLLSMRRQFLEATQKILDLDAGRFQVIAHFNFPGVSFWALPQFRRLKRRGVLIVFTVHDVIPHRWLLPRWMNGWERWVTKSLYESADALVVHHESQREILEKEFGISPGCVSVVHHGVFSLSDEPLPYQSGDEFIALCFGAIRENKGVALAIEAVQGLRREGVPVRLLIAGGVSQGEAGYWEKCKEMIASAPEGIDVIDGYIPESDIRLYFERSHFVLLPYSDFFSQSGVATMALSSGRPIVSTGSGGLGALIGSGKFGVMIQKASTDDVASAIRRAVGLGHEGLSQMGKGAYSHFFKNYSWGRAADLHQIVYRSVLKERV